LSRFRFEDLEIWKESTRLWEILIDVCDRIEKDHLYRFAEQLRGASLSICNNIAEGSGSGSRREFAQFLNIARRSCFETANIVILFGRRNWIPGDSAAGILDRIDMLCRKITNFQKSLKSREKSEKAD
jgi:four helix bundle protein